MVLMNAKALTPEEATAKISTIQQIIMAINALSKVPFINNLSLGSDVSVFSYYSLILWHRHFLEA